MTVQDNPLLLLSGMYFIELSGLSESNLSIWSTPISVLSDLPDCEHAPSRCYGFGLRPFERIFSAATVSLGTCVVDFHKRGEVEVAKGVSVDLECGR